MQPRSDFCAEEWGWGGEKQVRTKYCSLGDLLLLQYTDSTVTLPRIASLSTLKPRSHLQRKDFPRANFQGLAAMTLYPDLSYNG